MKVPIKIPTEKKTFRGHLPTSWDDVSLKTWWDILGWMTALKVIDNKPAPDGEDMAKLWGLLCGIPWNAVARCTNLSMGTVFETHAGFIMKELGELEKRPLPDTIEIDGKDVKVPRDLKNVKELIQLFDFEAEVDRVMKDKSLTLPQQNLKRDCLAIAFFMYQEIKGTKKYDGKKALKMADSFAKMPVTQAVPITVFFWKKLRLLMPSGNNGFTKNLPKKKSRQGLTGWLGQATLPQWMHWPKVMSLNWKKWAG